MNFIVNYFGSIFTWAIVLGLISKFVSFEVAIIIGLATIIGFIITLKIE